MMHIQPSKNCFAENLEFSNGSNLREQVRRLTLQYQKVGNSGTLL